MKIKITLVLAVISLTVPLLAGEKTSDDSVETTSFQPCRSWKYSNNGYLCSFTGGYLNLYTTAEVDALVDAVREPLQNQIDALTARVKKIEEK